MKDHLPRPVGNILPDIAQDTLVSLFAARGHFWLMFSLAITRTSRCFSAKFNSPQYCSSAGAGICLSPFGFLPFLQPFEVPLDSLTFCSVPPLCSVNCKFPDGTLKKFLGPRFPTAESQSSTSGKNDLEIEMYCNKESLNSVSSKKDPQKKKSLGTYILIIYVSYPYVIVQSKILGTGVFWFSIGSLQSLGGPFLFFCL